MNQKTYYASLVAYLIMGLILILLTSTMSEPKVEADKFQKVLNAVKESGHIWTKHVIQIEPKKVVFAMSVQRTPISLMVSETEGKIICSLQSETTSHRWHVSYPESVTRTIKKVMQK